MIDDSHASIRPADSKGDAENFKWEQFEPRPIIQNISYKCSAHSGKQRKPHMKTKSPSQIPSEDKLEEKKKRKLLKGKQPSCDVLC